MKISCFRCGGDGHLPQFEWNKGGICFTCGGDGIVNTFSTIKLNKMTDRAAVKSYLQHSSNRDLAELAVSGENMKMKSLQLGEYNKEFKRRAEEYYGMTNVVGASPKHAKEMLRILEEREKNMPKPYEKHPYFKEGKVSLVPVHWLQKFHGNNLRRDTSEMEEFSEQLLKEGLKEPVMMMIGQNDRSVSIGEGNHRTAAFLKAGLDFIPVRVSRTIRTTGTPLMTYYDKMSRVPLDDYFKGDASPEEVFDTFYDHDYTTPMDADLMKKLDHKEIKVPSLEGKRLESQTVKGIFGKQFKSVSKTLNNQLNEMVEEFFAEGGSTLDLEKVFLDEAGDWKSKADGIIVADIENLVEQMEIALADIRYNKMFGKKEKSPAGNTPNWDEMDLDDIDLESLLEDI